jgi:hypothetical protein
MLKLHPHIKSNPTKQIVVTSKTVSTIPQYRPRLVEKAGEAVDKPLIIDEQHSPI